MSLGAALGVEPGEQLFQAGALQALGLQQLGQVQQVGQAAFAIHQRQQSWGNLLLIQPGAEGAHKALLLPELVIALGVFALAVPGLGILGAGRQHLGAAAQQAAGQGIAQCTLAAGLGIGREHGGQFGGLFTVPDVLLATTHAGHATGSQFRSYLAGLTVTGDQYGNIAAFEWCTRAVLFEIGPPSAAGGQYRRNAPGRISRH